MWNLVGAGGVAGSARVYRQLRYFRAGLEGVISWLKHVLGLDRETWRCPLSFRVYVRNSILSSNLLVLAGHPLA